VRSKLEASGANVTLIEGGGGVFEIVCDGSLLFSKKQTHRFPTEDEVDKLLR
jgi:selT/selW/selH-like putative selenoprotein